jgi:hypothetical protein
MKVAPALVRAWAALYTWGLPETERRARRDEIESDLWESTHGDPSCRSTSFELLVRLAMGIRDDLGWRSERAPARPVLVATLASAGVIAATMWMIAHAVSIHSLPLPARVGWHARFDRPPGPPPPPPPPPCPPSGAGEVATPGCSRP